MANPTFIDIFCGCGGMSLGFEKAGFECRLGLDNDPVIASTFALNRKSTPVLLADIHKISFDEVEKVVGIADALIGGPPCQGFSIASQSKPEATRRRKRRLYYQALRALNELNPEVFLFENVANILKYAKPIERALKRLNRKASFRVLHARGFGVPQVRARAFLTDDDVQTPRPSSTIKTPREVLAGLSSPTENPRSDKLHVLRKPNTRLLERIRRAKVGGPIYEEGKGWTFRKLDPDKPTISINAGGDLAHWAQDRWLSFREFLRLQRMPDSYKFYPSRLREQVARILPPPFAKAWAIEVRKAIRGKKKMRKVSREDFEKVVKELEEDVEHRDSRRVFQVPVRKEELEGRHPHPHLPNGAHVHEGLPPASGAHAHVQTSPEIDGRVRSGPLKETIATLGGHRHRPDDPLEGAHIATQFDGAHDHPVALGRPPILPLDLLVELHETRPWLLGFKRAWIRERSNTQAAFGPWREWTRFDSVVHVLHPVHWQTEAMDVPEHERWFTRQSPDQLIDKVYEFEDGTKREPTRADWEGEERFIRELAEQLRSNPLEEFLAPPFTGEPVVETEYVVQEHTFEGTGKADGTHFDLRWFANGVIWHLRMFGDLRRKPRVEAQLLRDIDGRILTAEGEFGPRSLGNPFGQGRGILKILARGKARIFQRDRNKIALELLENEFDIDRVIARRTVGNWWIVAGGKVTNVVQADEKQEQRVRSEGPRDAVLAVIGDGPGRIEQEEGRPLVGPSGKFLRTLIEEMGVDPEKIYYGNIFERREEKQSLENIAANAKDRIEELKRLPNLKVVLALSDLASKALTGTHRAISEVRGQEFRVEDFIVIPTFHPAAVMRTGQRRSEFFPPFRKDVRQALSLAGLLKIEKQREGKFVLQRTWWKIVQVVREGPTQIFWNLRMDFGDRSLQSFKLFTDPLKNDMNAAEFFPSEDKRLFEAEGVFKPNDPLGINPLKEGNVNVEILDRGEVTRLIDDEGFKKYVFKGDKFKNVWAARDEGGNVWSFFATTAGPGEERTSAQKIDRASPDAIMIDKGERREFERVIPILKVDDEEHLVHGVVYSPDTPDADGDSASPEEIKKAAHRFMLKYQRLAFMHKEELSKEKVGIAESYIAQESFRLGKGFVKKGSWILVTKVFDDALWKKVQQGEITGYSMGGSAFGRPQRRPLALPEAA